jgi:hypothetical protein
MSTLAETARRVGMPLYRSYHRRRTRGILKPLIAGQRVLIVGTGPSAAELGSIPGDVRIFTCKDGLSLFAERAERRHVDVYACIRSRLLREPRLAELFERTRPTVVMSNDVRYVARRQSLRGLYATLVYDAGEDNTIVRKLIAPLSVADICGNALRPKISTGMRLLHYAVHFGAREIYVLGIDLGRDGYVWGSRQPDRPWNHADIDDNFIKTLSARYDHIFSVSPKSPVAEYLPYRPMVGLDVQPARGVTGAEPVRS